MLFSGLGLVLLLLVACILEPSPRGYGTHGQLGLGNCFFVEQWNVRCPSCGMTTAWSLLVRGRPLAALHATAGGVMLLLFLLCWMLVILANWGLRFHDI